MAAQGCTHRLEGLVKLVHHNRPFMTTHCILNIIFSLVTVLGNLLAIHALWKASAIPTNFKKLLMSLACSDLAMGLVAQLMYGVSIALMLKMAADGNRNFDSLCPTVINVTYFSAYLLACASFLNVIAIAVDRLLAVSLHLRYQELVTSKRVITALVCLWVTSGVASAVYISVQLSKSSYVVTAALQTVGLLLTAVAYVRIYKIARYHLNQIDHQAAQVSELIRQKESVFNAFFIHAVFMLSYLPHLCVVIFFLADYSRISVLAAYHATFFIVALNSSLNPLVYCWRNQEIRGILKNTVKKIFRITNSP